MHGSTSLTVRSALVIGAVCVGLGLVDGPRVSAQSQEKAPAGDVRVTVIGCVRRAEIDPRRPEDSPRPEAAVKFVLTDITLSDDSPNQPGDRDAASALLAQNVKAYRLDDMSAPQIAQHIGDRVEVTGLVTPAATGTSGSTDPTVIPAPAPKLLVESLRTISSTSPLCSR